MPGKRYPSSQKKNYGVVVTLIFLIGVIYFAFHAVSGERGLLALMQYNQKVKTAQEKYEQVHMERLQLEHRVTLLRPDSLDLDLLDEESRKLLGYAGKEEIILE